MKKQLLFFAIALMALVTGCKKESDPSLNNPTRLTIAGAKYIYENPAATKATLSELAQYMSINDKGERKPVRFIGAHGDTLDLHISYLKNLNSDYLILTGGFKFYDQTGSVMIPMLLVNKKTEAIYAINKTMYSIDMSYVYEDDAKNIYIRSGDMGMEDAMIHKLDISDPNAIKISNYIPTNQGSSGASNYIINKRGFCYWAGYNFIEPKIKCPQERIYTVQELLSGEKYEDIHIFKSFLNDNLHIITSCRMDNNKYIFKCYELTEQGLNTLVLTLKDELICTGYGYLYQSAGIHNHVTQSHLFSTGGSNNYTLQYNENSSKLSLLDLGIPEIKTEYNNDYTHQNSTVGLSSAFMYDKTANEFFIIKLSDNSVNKISLVGKYELYTMEGNPNSDEVTFSGLRFSDGKNVVGTIDKDGNFSVMESINANKETVLIRLN